MSDTKTVPTDVAVADYIAGVEPQAIAAAVGSAVGGAARASTAVGAAWRGRLM